MQEHTSWHSIILKESTISFPKLSTVLPIFSLSFMLWELYLEWGEGNLDVSETHLEIEPLERK